MTKHEGLIRWLTDKRHMNVYIKSVSWEDNVLCLNVRVVDRDFYQFRMWIIYEWIRQKAKTYFNINIPHGYIKVSEKELINTLTAHIKVHHAQYKHQRKFNKKRF